MHTDFLFWLSLDVKFQFFILIFHILLISDYKFHLLWLTVWNAVFNPFKPFPSSMTHLERKCAPNSRNDVFLLPGRRNEVYPMIRQTLSRDAGHVHVIRDDDLHWAGNWWVYTPTQWELTWIGYSHGGLVGRGGRFPWLANTWKHVTVIGTHAKNPGS